MDDVPFSGSKDLSALIKFTPLMQPKSHGAQNFNLKPTNSIFVVFLVST